MAQKTGRHPVATIDKLKLLMFQLLTFCLCLSVLLGCGMWESDAEKRARYKEIAKEEYPWAGESGIGLVAHNRSDYDFAYREWKPLAEKGDPEAQNFLGNLYSDGRGVKKDRQEAMRWYRKAAEQGHAGAMFNIASNYERGDGMKVDYAEAVLWYKMAAEKGHDFAMRRLGEIYESIPDYESETLAYMWYDLTTRYAEHPLFDDEKRDEIARRMTPGQIEEAKQLVREWEEKHGRFLKRER